MNFKIVFLAFSFFLISLQASAQVGIGTDDPNASAQLDIVSSDKGMLIPRIALSGVADSTSILNGNVESLLVYNTFSGSGVTPGFYYWTGFKWEKLVNNTHLNNYIADPFRKDTQTVNADYVILNTDETIYVSAISSDIVVTLPSDSVSGDTIVVKKNDSSDEYFVTVESAAPQQVNDFNSIKTSVPYQVWVIRFDGTNWNTIN